MTVFSQYNSLFLELHIFKIHSFKSLSFIWTVSCVCRYICVRGGVFIYTLIHYIHNVFQCNMFIKTLLLFKMKKCIYKMAQTWQKILKAIKKIQIYIFFLTSISKQKIYGKQREMRSNMVFLYTCAFIFLV